MAALSETQQRALDTLKACGKMTEGLLRDRGFRIDTFEILEREGFARSEVRSGYSIPFTYRVYFPVGR